MSKKSIERVALRRFAPSTPRREARQKGLITSLGTLRIAKQCLRMYGKWRLHNGLPPGRQDNRLEIVAYLEERAELVTQKTLTQETQALSKSFKIRLPSIRSKVETILSSRDYSLAELDCIVKHQTAKHALASIVAFAAGLRCHELATLRRLDELAPSSHRDWDSRLFLGASSHVVYVVVGKGGLRRKVAIPNRLARALEKHRLPSSCRVRDRGINYDMVYDIGYGQAFSQSFTRASKKALGYSTGAHGLRHSYAKRRTRLLLDAGMPLREVQLIVSQELGHFRPDIVLAYYR